MLEPQPVLDKSLAVNWGAKMIAAGPLIGVQAKTAAGIRDAGCRPGRTEEHAERHARTPKLHGLAKDTNLHPFNLAEVGSRRKPVRASTDNRYITHRHRTCVWVREGNNPRIADNGGGGLS